MKDFKLCAITILIILSSIIITSCSEIVGGATDNTNEEGNSGETDIPKPTYTVTFDSNGGSEITDIISVESGKTIVLPIHPSQSYSSNLFFAGWYTKQEPEEQINENSFSSITPVTANLTVFAKWISKEDPSTDIYEYVLNQDGYTYAIRSKSTSFKGTEIEVPSSYDEKTVTAIADNGFTKLYNSFDLTTFILPDTITSIGTNAFERMNKVQTITLSQNLITIGEGAFELCDALTEIIIPETVTSIGSYAFYGCDELQKVRLPDSLTTINTQTFYQCSKLSDINIPSKLRKIDSSGLGWTALTHVSLPEGFTHLGSGALSVNDSLKSITIPDTVTYIGSGAVSNTAITEFTFPPSIESIPMYMFSGCEELVSFEIPKTIKKIEEFAFEGCTKLSEIIIPDTVTEIGYNVFQGTTALHEITLPKDLTTIPGGLFYYSGLTSITIPASVKTIERSAFSGCTNMTSIFIPETVDHVGHSAFANIDTLEIRCAGSSSRANDWDDDWDLIIFEYRDVRYHENIKWNRTS